MAIPETDIHRIRFWCCERVPEHLWPQVKVGADVAPRHVTIVEVRTAQECLGRPHPLPDRSTALHLLDGFVGDLLA